MLQQIIDRRLSGKNKSIGNRDRFLRRYRDQIREAVGKAVGDRSIRDIAQGENITVPKRSLSEPVFSHGPGGTRDMVHPGNKEFVRGDRIARPQGGAGGNGSSGSPDGEDEDDFIFQISREEFMQYFFEDLALPRMLRTELAEVPEWRSRRAGFASDGTPNNIHVVRSMRGALGRRIALGGALRKRLREAEETLARAKRDPNVLPNEIARLMTDIETLKRRLARIPYLDPIDLRYRNRVRVPEPSSKAVMFCLMDVSGSMDENRKDIAKRFFILLYLFLVRHYERIEIVFIRHHTQAEEVGEQEFFESRETGGTVVSSALELVMKIVAARYPSSDWNVYAAQASDGDNWQQDSPKCRGILETEILRRVRYYAYVQVVDEEQNLWEEYSQLRGYANFAMQKIATPADIYPVFRELFKKGVATTGVAA